MITNLQLIPSSLIAPHCKELRMALKINSLVNAFERYGLIERAPDLYYWLFHLRDDIKQWHDDVFKFSVINSVTHRKNKFIPDDNYKEINSLFKKYGVSTTKKLLEDLMTDDELRGLKNTILSDVQIEKANQLKLNRLMKTRLDWMDRMSNAVYEAYANNWRMLFITLTSAPGNEAVFDVGNDECGLFIDKVQKAVARAWLIDNGQKPTTRNIEPLMDDVCPYIRVYEHGDLNGRAHAHFVVIIKALPAIISNPAEVNSVSATDLTMRLPGIEALWSSGECFAVPVRYGGDPWTSDGYPAPKRISPTGAVEQSPVNPIEALVRYLGAYLHKAFEVDLCLKTYAAQNPKKPKYYNMDDVLQDPPEEDKRWRVKTSDQFGLRRLRQLIAKAPIERLLELLELPRSLRKDPPMTKNEHLPSWSLTYKEIMRRLTSEGTLAPYYQTLSAHPNLYQQGPADTTKTKRILSYALRSSGVSYQIVMRNIDDCKERRLIMLMQKFYDDFIPPLPKPQVLLGGANRG